MSNDASPAEPGAATNGEDRTLATLEKLMSAPVGDLKTALTYAADTLAVATRAEKVDAFIYDPARDSLVAVGTSTQPLSMLQRRLGLDVLPLSNGGRPVYAYRTGKLFRTGHLRADPEELRGVKEGLQLESKIAVPLEVGGHRVGAVVVASRQRDFFTDRDEAFMRTITRWVGVVAHRAQLLEDMEHNALEEGRRNAAEEIITVLAHDLRNSLSPIALRLYTLLHRANTENRPADVGDANLALAALSRVTTLLTDLLDAARLDEGAFQINAQPMDVVPLLQSAAELLSMPEQPIVIKPLTSIVAMVDATRMRQCIDNLLTNAVAHTPKGGTVTVLVARRDEADKAWGCVEVVDEGPGVPEHLVPHVFDRFITGRARQGGVGMGLYIAKRIARAHGGDLVVDRYPGKGARFTLTVPLAMTDGPGNAPPARGAPGDEQGTPPHG
jgi:two-component system, OmpR family, sensor kinase